MTDPCSEIEDEIGGIKNDIDILTYEFLHEHPGPARKQEINRRRRLLREQLREKEQELKHCRAEHHDYDPCQDLVAEIDEITHNIDQNTNRIQGLNSSLEMKENALNSCRRDNPDDFCTNLEAEIAGIEADIDALTYEFLHEHPGPARKQEINRERRQLREQLKEKEEEFKGCQHCQDIKNEINSIKNEKQQLENANASLKAEVRDKNGQLMQCLKTPGRKKIAVTCYSEQQVHLIDLLTNIKTGVLLAERSQHEGPFGITFSPDGTKLYVVNELSADTENLTTDKYEGVLYIFDLSSELIKLNKVKVGFDAKFVAASPDGTKVYVTNPNQVPNKGTVSVINTETYSKTDMPVGVFPTGVRFNHSGTLAYVANSFGKSVTVIDATNNQPIEDIDLNIEEPYGVAVSPDGKKVYITHFGDEYVSVIDAVTNKLRTTIKVGKHPFGVIFNPQGTRAYVSNYGNNTVSVIDSINDAQIGIISVGKGPKGIVIDPKGAKIYVCNSGWSNYDQDNTISVIDTTNNTVIKVITVGNSPIDITIG